MKKIKIKSYTSSDMVLLAFDWYDGKKREDFLGFAIKRSPGFHMHSESWLPNRLSFSGPAAADATGRSVELPSDKNPIQKFMWWDARFEDGEKGKTYTYTIYAVTGTPGHCVLENDSKESIKVNLNDQTNIPIETYFNRAVVSSQAFSNKFITDGQFDESKLNDALAWLSNGLGDVISSFINGAGRIDGAIYHLTDQNWIIPALKQLRKPISIVHHAHKDDHASQSAIDELERENTVEFWPRTHTSIMHNKFLVASEKATMPERILMGSANFTTEGLTEQANLYHVFKSPELAKLYLERKNFLRIDPSKAQTQQQAGWSEPIDIGAATVRVFFFPEKSPNRNGMDPIVEAINNAKQSVVFCIFTPTDAILREAIFNAGDQGKMMFGLVNSIPDEEPDGDTSRSDTQATVEIYHRSRENKDVYDHAAFTKSHLPAGFWWELNSIPKSVKSKIPPVFIHHKFIVIDGETDNPIIFSGSANMSNNSNYNNDENLIEITNAPEIGKIYLAEFLRLYEHYRARAQFVNGHKNGTGKQNTFKLTADASWCKDDYTAGNPKYKSRITMAY